MTREGMRVLACTGIALMLAGCGSSSSPSSATSQPVPSRNLARDHVQNRRFTLDIRYPPLSPSADVLTRALHARGEAARHALMQAVKAAPMARPLRLALVFEVASRTPRFLSVREKGFIDAGGAHPVPLHGNHLRKVRPSRQDAGRG